MEKRDNSGFEVVGFYPDGVPQWEERSGLTHGEAVAMGKRSRMAIYRRDPEAWMRHAGEARDHWVTGGGQWYEIEVPA